MTEVLQKIEAALKKHAPSVMRIESCGNKGDEGWCVDSLLLVGRRLAFLISEYTDGCVELFVRESDCNEEPCRLLVHERWHVVCRVVILLEANRLEWIQTSEPIELRDRSGALNTVVDSESCQG